MSNDKNLEDIPSEAVLMPMPLPVPAQPNAPATQAATPKLSLIPTGDLISQVFDFYKKHWKLFLQIFVWPLILNCAWLVLTSLSDLIIKQNEASLFVSVVGWITPLIWLLIMVISIWSGAALIFACKEPTTWQLAYRSAWHRLGDYLWLAILTGLMVAGGIMLFVVPGIIFSLWFFLGAWVLIFEDLKGRDALLKSKFYVQGYWWAIFGRQLVFSLLIAAIAGGAMLLGLLLSFLVKTISSTTSSILIIVWQCLVSLLISPLTVGLSYVLYQDLKNKKSAVAFEIMPRAKKHLTWWVLWGALSGPIIILAIITALIVASLWLPDAQSLLISGFYG